MEGSKAVYKGYVDDPRNTDNAWMEMSTFHKHLNNEESKRVCLKAGDDAAKVFWVELTLEVMGKMYVSHSLFVQKAIEAMNEESAEVILAIQQGIKGNLKERIDICD